MTTLLLMIAAGTAGYAASVFTWPVARQWWIGIDNEIADLRAKLRAFDDKPRGG